MAAPTRSIATKGEPSRADRESPFPVAVVPGIGDITVVDGTVDRNLSKRQLLSINIV